jgi:predicted component of type VI protein secretion system
MYTIEMELRARIEERHREAQEARLAYGLLRARRSQRKSEDARLQAERALAESHLRFEPQFSR